MKEDSNYSYFFASIFFFILRLVGDIILFSFDKLKTSQIELWNLLSSLAIIIPLVYYFFVERKELFKNDFSNFNDIYLDDFNKTSLLNLSLVVSIIIVSALNLWDFEIKSVFQVALNLVLSVFQIICNIFVFRFIFKWINFKKEKSTKLKLNLIYSILAYFILHDVIEIYANFNLNSLTFLDVLGYIGLISITWISISKSEWISMFPKKSKLKLIGYAIYSSVSTIILIISMNSDNIYYQQLHDFFPLLSSISKTILIIFLTYMGRVFLSTLISLPTSRLVDQKNSELNSLTYLNKLVAENVDHNFDELTKTVANLALNTTGASGVWVELLDDTGNLTISYSINITNEDLNILYLESGFNKYSETVTNTLVIESVLEDSLLRDLFRKTNFILSLIILPLKSEGMKIGNIILYYNEEYGFERSDINLLNAFSDNVKLALDYSKLIKDSIAKDRFKQELMLAHDMQQKLLPKHLPIIDNFTISAISYPANEVGGDYYDIVTLKDGNHCVLIGDVSGKGMSAAFFMAQLKGMIMAASKDSNSPSELLKKANNLLYGNFDKNMYITLCAIKINQFTKNISIVRAGHTPIFIKNNNEIISYIPKGLGIGLANSSIFDKNLEEIELSYDCIDELLLFSDGINELRNDDDDEFGMNSLINIMKSKSFCDSNEFLETIMSEINSFKGSIQNNDDMTIVTLVKKSKIH